MSEYPVSLRAALWWIAAYFVAALIALWLLDRVPDTPGRVPKGRWFSVVTQGDTTTTRQIEFPWGQEGIWTMHRTVAGTLLGSDYTMFRMTPAESGGYCLRIASESVRCLSLLWTPDSVIVRSEREVWRFQRAQ